MWKLLGLAWFDVPILNYVNNNQVNNSYGQEDVEFHFFEIINVVRDEILCHKRHQICCSKDKLSAIRVCNFGNEGKVACPHGFYAKFGNEDGNKWEDWPRVVCLVRKIVGGEETDGNNEKLALNGLFEVKIAL